MLSTIYAHVFPALCVAPCMQGRGMGQTIQLKRHLEEYYTGGEDKGPWSHWVITIEPKDRALFCVMPAAD